MTVRAWRIVQAHLADTAFSGEGARLYGGRWNRPGVAVVYTAGSRALALLELLAHVGALRDLPAYVCIPADFDESLVRALDTARLPRLWRASPAPDATRALGSAWAQRLESAVLRVPSVLVPEEHNYLLNPRHPDFRRVRAGAPVPFHVDPRLRRAP